MLEVTRNQVYRAVQNVLGCSGRCLSQDDLQGYVAAVLLLEGVSDFALEAGPALRGGGMEIKKAGQGWILDCDGHQIPYPDLRSLKKALDGPPN